MAKITRSQAEQIETAYNEICDITAKYPDVEVCKNVKDGYDTLASVNYICGDIEILLRLDGVTISLRSMSYCLIGGRTLSIGASNGSVDISIIDE